MAFDFLVRDNQERYLLAERFTDASYPIPYSYRLRGKIDLPRLNQAIETVIESHDILRTSFQPEGTGFSGTVADSGQSFQIAVVDAHNADEAEIRRHFINYFYRKLASFTPTEMIRAQVIHLPDDECILSLSLHHIIADGISMGAFTQEVFARYNGTPITPSAQFTDVQPDGNDEAAARFWRDHLADVETIAEIPADLDGNLPNELQKAESTPVSRALIDGLATRLGVRPFAVLSAISNLIFAKYSGMTDILLTFQSSGRRGIANAEQAIGPFSNSVILRTKLTPDMTFAALAQGQKEGIRQALKHEAEPYHQIVRETRVQPKFGINLFPVLPPPAIDGTKVIGPGIFYVQTNYDLDFRFEANPDAYVIRGIYDNNRFSTPRVRAILDDFARIATQADANPDDTVQALWGVAEPLIAPTITTQPQGRLFDAFLQQAATAPERPALVTDTGIMTYGQVEEASAQLARRLVADGLGVGSRVAILAERGPQLVWTMLAVLRIGATMVPLDSNYPAERLATLISVAHPDALVVPERGATPDWATDIAKIHAAIDKKAKQPAPATIPDTALAAGDPDNPAYILFTSGSTGTPKGVATSHRPVLNFLQWQRENFDITADDLFTNLNGLAHDMMVRDLFAPLSVGARLAIPHQEDIFRPDRLVNWLTTVRPTMMHLTPAMGNLLSMAATDETHLPLRFAFSGGDRLLPENIAALRAIAPDVQVVNFYGATETPQAAGHHICDPDMPWRSYPVGRGIDHFALRIVDQAHQSVPNGTPGEIAILSPFISLGYVKDGEIVPHENADTYFTGDMGFALPSGDVVFTGRKDDQISIRGYRIELGEIEQAMRDHPAVQDARVLFQEKPSPHLVGFAAGDDLDEMAIYAWLNRTLPAYMVPSEILCLDEIPLLPNGKTDRQKLLATPREQSSRLPGRPPETAMERELVAIWEDVLGVEGISPEQSFAELRGDSLNFVQVLLATEAKVGQLPDLWELMPLAEIAEKSAPPPRFYKWVDSSVLVRAIAIMVIVSFHFKLFALEGGGTTALFMVTGFLIGRLQIQEAWQSRSAAPIWRLAFKILIPVALFVTLLYFYDPIVHNVRQHPSVYLLYVDFSDLIGSDLLIRDIYIWYVSATIKIFIVFALIITLVFRAGIEISARNFVFAMFALACVLRFVLPLSFDDASLTLEDPSASITRYLPTTHFATIMLGMCFAYVDGMREKIVMFGIVLLYAALTQALLTANTTPILLIFFGFIALFVPRLPLPRGVHRIVLLVSGASLFIYLSHLRIGYDILPRFGVPIGSVLQWVLAIAIGIGAWYLWQRVSYWGNKHLTIGALKSRLSKGTDA